VGIPATAELQHLDSLRAQLARLRSWGQEGPPLRYRWGLYTGDDMLDTLRALYFQRFDRMLWNYTRARLVGSLGTLPATPTEANEYGTTYDALKAYLITTSHPRESTVDFLAPELMEHWTTGRDIDAERTELAQRQFAFFAAELPFGNPYPQAPDDALVARTRDFLRAFGNTDQFYQALIGQASNEAEAARFESTATVSDAVVVPGAYTTAGWEFVQTNLQNLDRLFTRESWVLGDATVPEGDRARIASELRTRYSADYITQWQGFLAAARVARFGGPQDAASKLGALSAPQSPLLRLLALVAVNTAVDTLAIGDAFQPVHTVMPPTATDRLIVEPNQPYMQGLIGLQTAMEQVASAQGAERDGAMGSASNTADQIKVQVR
ncbi:MAG: ImcF-related family protein, partial [Longimicrobiales bacterium]